MEKTASNKVQSFTDQVYKYMKESGIYRDFKPRPHCVGTVLVLTKDNFEDWFKILTKAANLLYLNLYEVIKIGQFRFLTISVFTNFSTEENCHF